MIAKRFTWEYSNYDSTGEIHDWSRSYNAVLMTDYLQKWELEEWCHELNKIVDENNQLRKENEQLKERITDKNIETEIEIGKYIEKVLKVIDEENEKYWLKEKTSLRKEAKIYNSFRRSLTKIGMELF